MSCCCSRAKASIQRLHRAPSRAQAAPSAPAFLPARGLYENHYSFSNHTRRGDLYVPDVHSLSGLGTLALAPMTSVAFAPPPTRMVLAGQRPGSSPGACRSLSLSLSLLHLSLSLFRPLCPHAPSRECAGGGGVFCVQGAGCVSPAPCPLPLPLPLIFALGAARTCLRVHRS